MGRLMGIEPMYAGATIQCVNRFTKAAVIIFCKRTREPRDSRVPLRQLPTLPRRLQRSTLGLRTLNCCVRNGNRWYRPGIITALLECCSLKTRQKKLCKFGCEIPSVCRLTPSSSYTMNAPGRSSVIRYCLRKSVSIRSALMPPTAHSIGFARIRRMPQNLFM